MVSLQSHWRHYFAKGADFRSSFHLKMPAWKIVLYRPDQRELLFKTFTANCYPGKCWICTWILKYTVSTNCGGGASFLMDKIQSSDSSEVKHSHHQWISYQLSYTEVVKEVINPRELHLSGQYWSPLVQRLSIFTAASLMSINLKLLRLTQFRFGVSHTDSGRKSRQSA